MRLKDLVPDRSADTSAPGAPLDPEVAYDSGRALTGDDNGRDDGPPGAPRPVASTGLPHPAPTTTVQGTEPLDNLDADRRSTFELLVGVAESLKRIAERDDQRFIRSMRGPLVGNAQITGASTATIQLPAVPPGEMWILDALVVTADAALSTIGLWDSEPNASSALMIDKKTTYTGAGFTVTPFRIPETPCFPGTRLVVTAAGTDVSLRAKILYRAFRTYGAAPESTWD